MSAFSQEMQQVAVDLLTEFGQAVSFLREVKGSYDPNSLQNPVVSTTTYSGFGVPTAYLLPEIDGTLVQADDIKLLAHIMTEVPLTSDQVNLGGINYRIQRVVKTVVNGEDVIYELQLRV